MRTSILDDFCIRPCVSRGSTQRFRRTDSNAMSNGKSPTLWIYDHAPCHSPKLRPTSFTCHSPKLRPTSFAAVTLYGDDFGEGQVSFSAIIAAAVAFGFWWISSQTTPLLVIFLSAIGFLDGEITIRTNASGGRPSATAAHPSKWRGVFDRRFLTCFLSSFPIRPTSLLLFTTF